MAKLGLWKASLLLIQIIIQKETIDCCPAEISIIALLEHLHVTTLLNSIVCPSELLSPRSDFPEFALRRVVLGEGKEDAFLCTSACPRIAICISGGANMKAAPPKVSLMILCVSVVLGEGQD